MSPNCSTPHHEEISETAFESISTTKTLLENFLPSTICGKGRYSEKERPNIEQAAECKLKSVLENH